MKQSKYLHSLVLATLLGIVLIGLPAASAAQDTTDHDINRTELRNFDSYLDSHPEVAGQLRANPSLVNDPAFLRSHPELQEFMNNHPGVRDEMKENPQGFLNRERGFDRHDGDQDTTRGEARNFDKFLDQHPQIAKDINGNPGLVNDPKFVDSHPALKDYLEDHPRVREEVKENPKAFMRRERNFEKRENNPHPRPRR